MSLPFLTQPETKKQTRKTMYTPEIKREQYYSRDELIAVVTKNKICSKSHLLTKVVYGDLREARTGKPRLYFYNKTMVNNWINKQLGLRQ
jgi:hypothetical protein